MVHGPLLNSSGSCLRFLSVSTRFFAAHALPSARQFAASAASALIFASRMTLASIALVLMEKSGLGSAANAVPSAAAHAMAPAKADVRTNAILRKDESFWKQLTGRKLFRRLAMAE